MAANTCFLLNLVFITDSHTGCCSCFIFCIIVYANFAKFTRKHLRCGIFFNEVVDLESQTLLKKRFIPFRDKIYVTEQSLLKKNMLKVNFNNKKNHWHSLCVFIVNFELILAPYSIISIFIFEPVFVHCFISECYVFIEKLRLKLKI